MPPILYGTAWKKQQTAPLVLAALQQGFRGIDTACQPRHYDEAGVGEALAGFIGANAPRDSLYLQTKFTPLPGHDPQRVPYDPAAPLAEQVRQSVACSLRNLRTDYLDALLLHSPLPTLAETASAWQAMEALADAGLVRRLGISNCYRLAELQQIHELVRIKPQILQNRFHGATGYDKSLREFCSRHRMTYQSFWTLTANPHILNHDCVSGLACEYSRSPAQILFRYLTQCGVVPLTGTHSVPHMQEDLAIFSFQLTPDQCRAMTALLE